MNNKDVNVNQQRLIGIIKYYYSMQYLLGIRDERFDD